jgi:hypothetical protein
MKSKLHALSPTYVQQDGDTFLPASLHPIQTAKFRTTHHSPMHPCTHAPMHPCSVAWLEDADCSDLSQETLKKQYQAIRSRVSANWTYMQGSHVERFGTLSIDEEPVGDFMGALNDGERDVAGRAHGIEYKWGG